MRKILFVGCLVFLLCAGIVWGQNANVYVESINLTSTDTWKGVFFPMNSGDLIITNPASSETVMIDLVYPDRKAYLENKVVFLEADDSIELYNFRSSGVSVIRYQENASNVTVISVY